MIKIQDIETEFEFQLNKLKNRAIRERVVEAWCRACQEGGWTGIEELRELPFTVITDSRGISLLQHSKAATEGAFAIAKIQMENIPSFPPLDMDVVIAGALLHDLNKVLIFERDENNLFKKRAGQPGFPGIRIVRETGLHQNIIAIIEYESGYNASPGNIEAIIVHHADMTTFDTMNFLNNPCSNANRK